MTKEREQTKADALLKQAQDLLSGVQDYKNYPEYKTLESRLIATCIDLNAIVVKEITGDNVNTDDVNTDDE